jgi:hypothetical protein
MILKQSTKNQRNLKKYLIFLICFFSGVNTTPDIVKSVESKAEEINKPNQAKIISVEVSNKTISVPDTIIGQETPAAGPDGQTYIPCQIQNSGFF